jgi:hypothetical protein
VHDFRSEIWENNVFCILILNNYDDNGIDVNVAVLANGNCTACCQQETNAMHLITSLLHGE